MSSIQEAQQALGELFIMGFSGLELSEETAAFISQAGVGGVILFSPNYENPAQVAELINSVQECRAGPLPMWAAVDYEGGRVQRFKKGFTKIPEAAQIGAVSSPKLIFEVAEMMAKELRAVGINLNFAPVADIATNPKNPVIGARAFGTDDETVTRAVTAMLRGHVTQGVQPCVKHFPGHGDTSTDSHFALPKIDTPLETLLQREFKPFIKAFKSRCSMVMTAHILCTQIDRDRPATLSSKILKDILRSQLRFSGLIISDDMEMKAITDNFGADEAPRLAIEAGCDILIYRSEATARAAYSALSKALESGTLSPDRVLESQKRIRDLKKDTLMPYQSIIIADVGKKVGTPEHQELISRINPQ